MRKEWILGKIFISHSSRDKRFVRLLAARLWEEGYQIWLDEKELVPGDALAERLSDALAQSRVVAVVITPNSIASNWLKFELNKATEKMVKGECRLIPLLRGDVEPPNELKSLIYADFRKSFSTGMKAVLAALNAEASHALRGSWAELRVLLGEVFDHEGNASKVGGYDSLDWDYVQIEGVFDRAQGDPFDDADIIYDIVHDYLGKREPLDGHWWNEYLDSRNQYPASFHLVVSERPTNFARAASSQVSGKAQVSQSSSQVQVFYGAPLHGSPLIVVIADISKSDELSERRTVLEAARTEIVRVASQIGRYKKQA
jgi:hypothetical protein